MEFPSQSKDNQLPIKKAVDKNILVEVFNNMDDSFMTEIYIQLEKTNSVRDIFSSAQVPQTKQNNNLHIKKF